MTTLSTTDPASGDAPSTEITGEDTRWMLSALSLARRGLGQTWPNPAVGCVLVKEGHVVGRGWTQPGGRPHAEAEALRRAGKDAVGATAYVSLEPCAHHGKTPPCADALIEAKVARVVVATGDPDIRVSGKGLARLNGAGVGVMVGVCADEAKALNAGFIQREVTGRPFVTLKLATSLDGRIAAESGNSKWLTGADARNYAHGLRARHDAILVGIGTVIADDPDLRCRLPGFQGKQPLRVVLDSQARLSAQSKLAQSAIDAPVHVFSSAVGGAEQWADGVTSTQITKGENGGVDPMACLSHLAGLSITRVMIEGGGAVAASFLKNDLVDEICWFRANCVVGSEGVPAVGSMAVEAIAEAPRYVRMSQLELGADLLETYRRKDHVG
jgi:diaminohydroxyphosphoribosylaminopyrimidine deaminase/5-amino-6-(5-phosphoribosylamino)uracil reductase